MRRSVVIALTIVAVACVSVALIAFAEDAVAQYNRQRHQQRHEVSHSAYQKYNKKKFQMCQKACTDSDPSNVNCGKVEQNCCEAGQCKKKFFSETCNSKINIPGCTKGGKDQHPTPAAGATATATTDHTTAPPPAGDHTTGGQADVSVTVEGGF